MKRCSKCGVTKALEDFFRKSSATDGRRSQCKSCDSRENRDRYPPNDMERKARVAAKAKEARRRRQAKDPTYKPRRRGRHWRTEHSDRWREVNRRQARKAIAELRDYYVAKQVVGRTGLCASQVPQALIDFKREQLRLHRASKAIKAELKKGSK